MRIAVLSDIHSNLVALDAVLAAIGRVDAIWVLGDIVGYGPEPDGVVERLVEIGAVAVAGNHDVAAVGAADLGWFNPDARAAIEWTQERMTPRTRAWLAALPTSLTEPPAALVHGSPREPLWEYITSGAEARPNLRLLVERGLTLGLHGHTHIPVLWRLTKDELELVRVDDGTELALDERVVLANPGSVGQPRDGDPRSSYLLYDADEGRLVWHRVAYDVAATQRAMREAGLPRWLVERLAVGH
ncbi:MAG TPA: metallophosphoesterase family protein [Candidatus Binatia bacterium]|nr:metallophosphoesterase family protein [Candidatus Binatia bacterium]